MRPFWLPSKSRWVVCVTIWLFFWWKTSTRESLTQFVTLRNQELHFTLQSLALGLIFLECLILNILIFQLLHSLRISFFDSRAFVLRIIQLFLEHLNFAYKVLFFNIFNFSVHLSDLFFVLLQLFVQNSNLLILIFDNPL